MAGTTLFDAADALATMLSGRSELLAVKCTVKSGYPGEATQPLDGYVSWDVANWSQSYLVSSSSTGATGLSANADESFVLQVRFLATSTDRFRARDLIKAVANVTADVCQADHTLQGTVQLAKVTGLALDQGLADERNHQVGLTVNVACDAWIDPGV
jgi:hypothetical protein